MGPSSGYGPQYSVPPVPPLDGAEVFDYCGVDHAITVHGRGLPWALAAGH